MLDVKILTAYPEMFPGSLEHSLIGKALKENIFKISTICLLYTSPSPRDVEESRMPSSA